MRNSTIIVKKKRCINCGNIDYHFSKKMCKQCATIASTQKRMEEFEDDTESFQNLVQDLDHVFRNKMDGTKLQTTMYGM